MSISNQSISKKNLIEKSIRKVYDLYLIEKSIRNDNRKVYESPNGRKVYTKSL